MKFRLLFFLIGSNLVVLILAQTFYIVKTNEVNTLKSEHRNYVDSLKSQIQKESELILLLTQECKRLEEDCQILSSTIAQNNYDRN